MKMETKDNATEANMVQFKPPSGEYLKNAITYGIGVAACMENMMFKIEESIIEVENTVNVEEETGVETVQWTALERVDVCIIDEIMDIWDKKIRQPHT